MSIHTSNLTSKQKKVYTVIENYLKVHGIPPTVREIGEMVGEKTPGAVQGILNRLEQKGVIKRQVGMARSIQLVSSDNTLYADPVFVPEIKKITKRNADDLTTIYNIEKYHPITPEFIKQEYQYVIYRCPNNIADGHSVNEGDMLLVALGAEPVDNCPVLALYDGHLLLRNYVSTEQPDTIKLAGDTSFIDKDTFNAEEITLIGRIEGKYSGFIR